MASQDPLMAESLPLSTLIHMITVKLTSSNYLLWKTQITSVFECQNLLDMVDGSTKPPSPTIPTGSTTSINPKYTAWKLKDRRISSLLLSSLTEETLAIVVGCTSSRDIWLALEQALSHDSKAREFSLKDELHAMKIGDRSVADYGRVFKTICDRLAAIGRPVDAADMSHWFLRGLGPRFANFSASQMAIVPLPSFAELLPRAASFEIFLKSMDISSSPTAAFVAHSPHHSGSSSHQKSSGGRFSHNTRNNGGRGGGRSQSGGTGRGNSGFRRPPRCQICRIEGHYADKCTKRYDRETSSTSANLAEAFQAGCNLAPSTLSDWYIDSGASAHMTSNSSTLDSFTPYSESSNQGGSGSRKA